VSSTLPLGDAAGPGVLTFLIADIRGYTAFTRARGDGAAARLAAAFAELAREGVEARGGTVIELRGDEALATFASPRQALRAATELQVTFADEAARDTDLPLHVGIGLDLGEAIPVEGGYRGAALNVAARLCANAAAGEILASESVTQLARGMEGIRLEPRDPFVLKGIDEPVRASAVTALALTGSEATSSSVSDGARIADLPMPLDPVVPMIGRDVEARRLRWAWRQARRGNGRSVVIGGPTGSGKTRLAAEPAAIARRDGALVGYASVVGPAPGVAAAIARALESGMPSLLVVDDLESASPQDLAALAEAGEAIADRPVLLIALVNDEPSDKVARLLRRLSDADGPLRLGPIDAAAVATIIATYAADAADPPPVWAISEASGGLPAQVHALASGWAQGEVARRLGSAVSRAAEGRRDLRRLESEVASNVVDLQLARERLRLIGPTGSEDVEACPFRGLVAFDVADADVFFGRERLVAEMVGRMAGSPFLGVVGPSGSGKSSAIRAGLLPALGAGALPDAESWTRVVLRPGPLPVRELDRVLFAALPEAARAALSAGEDPLGAAASILPPAARPLIVVDQFEELFTTTTDADERERFIDLLVNAAAEGLATVIVAVRADFYGRCAAYPGLAELLGANHVLVGPMTAEEYRRAIEGPARRAGLHFDPALVDALVVEVIDEPGGLPLLSTALVELWQRREGRAIRLAAYAATGGVRGAVGRLAEAAYARLAEDEQGVARGLFLRLASGEGDAVVRRRVALGELDATANEAVGNVVRVLTEARLLTVGEGTVEVAHEALLREWPRLQAWLEEDRAGRRLREHLIESAREWEGRGRDAGELYRGTRLATAIDWTTDHSLELNENEKAFLAESRRATAQEVDRQRRTNRRLRALLGVAVVALVVALGAGVLAAIQRGEAEHAAVAADAQRLGAQALTEKDLDRSLLLARQGVALDDGTATRANLLSALLRSPAAIGTWRPVSGRPLRIEVSPDGRDLLVLDNQFHSYLVDATTGQLIREMGEGFATFAIDGSVLRQTFGEPITIEVSSVPSPTVTRTVTFPAGIQTLSWSPDLSTIIVVDADRRGVTVLDPTTGATLRHIVAPPDTTVIDIGVHIDPGNVLLMVHPGYLTDRVQIQQAYEEPVQLSWFPAGANAPTAVIPALRDDYAWDVDVPSGTMAVAEEAGNVGIYDLATGQRRDLRLRHNGLTGMTFSPDGKTLVTAGDDHLLQVWDMATGELRETLAGHNGRVFAPALSDAGGRLTAWSVSLDGQLIEWDLSGDRRLGRPFAAGQAATLGDSAAGVAVSPDGRLLASTDAEGRVRLIDTETLSEVRRLDAVPGGQALAVAFSSDGRTLAVAGQGVAIASRWDVATGAAIGAPLPGPPATLPRDPEDPNAPATSVEDASRSIAFSPDGRWIAAGVEDGRIYVWDTATGATAGVPIRVGGPVFSVVFAPDSGSIAASFVLVEDGIGKTGVWAVGDRTLRYVVALEDDIARPYASAFSPDGALLVTAGGGGVVRFWDAGTGAASGRPIFANAGWVQSLAFDPSGTILVSAGTDGTTRLLETVGRQQLGSALPGGDSDVRAVLSPDGTRVFAVYADGHAFAWDISPEALEAHACQVAGRTLTTDEWNLYLPGRPYLPACGGGG
jgi:WD40 repeat protein